MSTLEKVQAAIYKARWVNGGIATDKAIAEAVLEALPATEPTPLLSPCCGAKVRIGGGWDGCDAFSECPECLTEWDASGDVEHWLAESE